MADLVSDPLAWRGIKAPSLAELEVMAGEIFRRLPERFRTLCADIVIQVDDFPSDGVLEEMQAETEFDLLGLFHGIGLPFRAESAPVQMPNTTKLWAPWSSMCWSTRSAIILASRTPTWRRSSSNLDGRLAPFLYRGN